jgi:glycosyltransferase involved in cell wall biosynthesis
MRREWGLEGKFVVGYSGNLGRAHDIATLLDAIERLEKRLEAATVEIVWLFVGGGVNRRRLRQEVDRRQLRSVILRDYQPRERLAESLSAVDVHLVSLRPSLEGLIQPSKIYGIMASGRPAIFIGEAEGETARLLARHDCGATVAEGDGEQLAATVVRLALDAPERARLGNNARLAFEANYEKGIAVVRWIKMLDRLAAK